MTRALVLLCALAVAGALVQGARADGDPASDYLITQPVYLPYDGKFTPELESQLLALLKSAKKQGFPIKVALIPNSYDLGAVGSLWSKPKLYARFLGEEDAPFFKQRLLVVMPSGFGFYRPGHDSATEDAALSKIVIAGGDDGLASAALAGVTKLAAAEGIHLAAPGHVTTQSQQDSHDRIVIIVAVAAALLLGALLRLVLRRRSSARRPGR
jgi:hypothetical protein